MSPAAVEIARGRGVLVIERSVFGDVPAAGSWRTALLLDGNIGIGGSPARLLTRVAALLAPRGLVLAELAMAGAGVVVHRLSLEHGGARSSGFQWAEVGLDSIDTPARAAGFEVLERWQDGGRCFALLSRG
jgi:hypothetical protein